MTVRSAFAHCPQSPVYRTGPSGLRRLLASTAAVLTISLLLVACGGSDKKPEAAPSASTDSPAPPPSAVSPLTGVAPAPIGPLVAVKIDNGVLARPFHRGLEKATVMYEELAEGGATRFLAVYDRSVDSEIGPIRSVRESDLELVAQYGQVTFGFSGGNSGVLAAVAKARAAGAVQDVSYDVAPQIYRKAEKRRDAQNFYSSPAKMAAVNPGATPAKDIGWKFGPVAPEVGTPVPSGQVSFSPMSSVGIRWDAPAGRWVTSQDGKDMPAVAPVNVIVQQVPIRESQFRDVTGSRTPYTTSVGEGDVSVLRDGKRIDGKWKRPDAASGTRFVDAAGADIPLTPGGATWVLLVPAGQALRVG